MKIFSVASVTLNLGMISLPGTQCSEVIRSLTFPSSRTKEDGEKGKNNFQVVGGVVSSVVRFEEHGSAHLAAI